MPPGQVYNLSLTWDNRLGPEVTLVSLEMTFTDKECEYVCVTTLTGM